MWALLCDACNEVITTFRLFFFFSFSWLDVLARFIFYIFKRLSSTFRLSTNSNQSFDCDFLWMNTYIHETVAAMWSDEAIKRDGCQFIYILSLISRSLFADRNDEFMTKWNANIRKSTKRMHQKIIGKKIQHRNLGDFLFLTKRPGRNFWFQRKWSFLRQQNTITI